jgi:hypothetical protein
MQERGIVIFVQAHSTTGLAARAAMMNKTAKACLQKTYLGARLYR